MRPGSVSCEQFLEFFSLFPSRPDSYIWYITMSMLMSGEIGNAFALASLEQLVEKDLQSRGIDPKRARIIFNGDFNWFNGVRRDDFVSLNQRIMTLVKENKAICIAGNIEAELGVKRKDQSDPSGCGCAYPGYVGDRMVSNADKIMAGFLEMTNETDVRTGKKPDKEISDIVDWLATLPFYARVKIRPQTMVVSETSIETKGEKKEEEGFQLGVVHGDATSLAGWGFAFEAMLPPDELLHEVLGLEITPTPDTAQSSFGDSRGGFNYNPTETELKKKDSDSCKNKHDSFSQSRGDNEIIKKYENHGLAFTAWEDMARYFQEAQVDAFACTHTCLPFMQNFQIPSGCPTGTGAGVSVSERVLVNNGSAGMPNFRVGARPVASATTIPTAISLPESGANNEDPMSYGVITRISIPAVASSSLPATDTDTNTLDTLRVLYGTVLRGIHIDALSLPYDKKAHIRQFLRDHPKHSPAYDSYHHRIMNGPQFSPHQANRIRNFEK